MQAFINAYQLYSNFRAKMPFGDCSLIIRDDKDGELAIIEVLICRRVWRQHFTSKQLEGMPNWQIDDTARYLQIHCEEQLRDEIARERFTAIETGKGGRQEGD